MHYAYPDSGAGIGPMTGFAVPTTVTLEMLRAGMAAYRGWDSDREELPALLVSVFCSMSEARHTRVSEGDETSFRMISSSSDTSGELTRK